MFAHVQPHAHATARLARRFATEYVYRLSDQGPTLDEIEFGALMHNMIVLIADDFEEHRLLMRQAVEKRGHRVVEARNVLETIEAEVTTMMDRVIEKLRASQTVWESISSGVGKKSSPILVNLNTLCMKPDPPKASA
ncbi:MAG: response regulator [Acidobacteria bacterium]|nr:response regulator [Acidobacteriota bacterium]